MLGRRAGIELHHAGDIGDRFHAAERENHADELRPMHHRDSRAPAPGARYSRCGAAEADNHDHHEHGRDREPKRNAAAVFRTEVIDHADHEHETHRRDPRVFARNAEITYRRPAAQRGRDEEICHQQKRAGRGEKAALLSRGGINAAAVGEMAQTMM